MMEIVDGDLERAVALDALFRAESGGVYRTLYAFTGGRADIAEEATAEAFARALVQGEGLRDPLAWIYRVAFRVAIDEVRRERRIGCSRATVRVHLYRARTRLRELLAEED